jgi:hypothetical protein
MINKNDVIRKTVSKLNKEYYRSIKSKIKDGIPLFIQRMSNDPELNHIFRMEAEMRYCRIKLHEHIILFRVTCFQCRNILRHLILIGNKNNISKYMFAYHVYAFLV